MDVSEGDSPRPGRFRGRAHRGLAALGQDQQAGEDDVDDFKAESGTEEDDEATLEEEEVKATESSLHYLAMLAILHPSNTINLIESVLI